MTRPTALIVAIAAWLALTGANVAHAGSRKPSAPADTVLVFGSRGMRCCCPCDLWLVRRQGVKRDTLGHWEYTQDAMTVVDSLSAIYKWEAR